MYSLLMHVNVTLGTFLYKSKTAARGVFVLGKLSRIVVDLYTMIRNSASLSAFEAAFPS